MENTKEKCDCCLNDCIVKEYRFYIPYADEWGTMKICENCKPHFDKTLEIAGAYIA